MRIGGNLEEMARLEDTFRGRSGDTETLRSQLQSAVDQHITANWEGPAAEAFREAWNSQFKPALQKLQQALDEAAKEVKNRTDAIRQAGS